MTNRNLADLHPDLLNLYNQWLANCTSAGLRVGVCETYRSSEEQDNAYAQGRETPGKIITNAKGGESPHNITLADGTPASCAFDFFILDENGDCDWNAQDDAWKQAISIGEALGLTSGSTFNIRDNDHLQLTNWKDYALS